MCTLHDFLVVKLDLFIRALSVICLPVAFRPVVRLFDLENVTPTVLSTVVIHELASHAGSRTDCEYIE